MKKTMWIGLTGVCLLAAFPLFLLLDTMPLFVFDEGRLANNAVEIVQNGNWIVAHYDGRPDLWNTKPPLMIWLQALLMKVIGINLIAVRLPSALAGLATIIAVFLFAFRRTRSLLPALGASLTLLTIPGFVANHSTRTGDYDALLTLWSTLFLFQFSHWIREENPARRKKHLWLAMGFFALGVLTKGIVIFVFLPGLLIFLAWTRKIGPLLRQPHFYYSVLAAIAVVAAWYLGREWALPGYLEAVVQNELGGRFLNVIENHEGPWYFYFQNLWKAEFLPWIGFIPLAVWFCFRDPDASLRPLWSFSLAQAFFFLLIISFAQTKLNWYAVPVFPLLGLAVGGTLGRLLDQVKNGDRPVRLLKGLALLGLFLIPFAQQVRQSYQFRDESYGWEQRQYGGYMKEIKDWPRYTVVQSRYNAHISFYVKKYNAEGRNVRLRYPHDLMPGDTILLCEEKVRKAVLDRWALEGLHARKNCGLYLVKEK